MMTNNMDHMDHMDEICVDEVPVEQAAPVKKSPRYVGRITLGVTLVFVGIIITLTLFLPGHRLLFLVKLLPLILVALGLEVLISASIYKDRPVKVGFGLTVLSLFLIAGSVCSTVLPSLWENYGPTYWENRNQMEQELKNSIYETLDHTLLDEVIVSVQPVGYSGDTQNIVHIDLLGDYADETAFTNAAAPMVQALSGMNIETLCLSAANTTDAWSLDLNRALIHSDTSAEALTPRVEHERFYLNRDGVIDSMPASRYDQLTADGLLVSADLLEQARQEGWDKGYQQGLEELQSEYDAQDAA